MDSLVEPGEEEQRAEPGVRLLRRFPSTTYGDLIVRYPYQRTGDYAYSFQESAKRLASTFQGNPEDDAIILPFLLLYRHAYELRLKHLIKYLAGVRRRHREPSNPNLASKVISKRLRYEHGHKLKPLFDELMEHYEALDLDSEMPVGIAEIVQLLHEADGTGMAFRYDEELPNTQEHTDFPALAQALDEQLTMLALTEDYVDGVFSAVPDDFRY